MTGKEAFSLALLLLAGGAHAQRTVTPPPMGESRPPMSNSITQDVVVTDKSGHPVPGLQEGDFTLLDNGKPTAIRSFAAVEGSSSREDLTQVILLVDEVNTSFVAVSQERTQLDIFLTRNQGRLPYPVTVIFLTDTGMKQMNQPSTDGNALAAQLAQEEGTLRDLRRSAGFYGAAEQMQISLRALRSLAATLTPVAGRKLVVWISPGWWLFDSPNVYLSDKERRGFFDAIVEFSDALREARMVLYAVNPLGTTDAGSIYNVEWEDFVKPAQKPNRADPGDVSLQVIAAQSGGQIFYGNNDVAGEIEKCVADGSAWYKLTFDTQQAAEGDTWHTITVKVDKPGLKVRTRNGYYAEP